jgi:hypothetical protein
LFNWIREIFFGDRIPTWGLFCDHGLLWSKDAPQFGVFSKERIEFFIDLNIWWLIKLFWQLKFGMLKYINANEHVKKELICQF